MPVWVRVIMMAVLVFPFVAASAYVAYHIGVLSVLVCIFIGVFWGVFNSIVWERIISQDKT